MEDLRKQANDLVVFYGKMQNRLSQAGVNDTGSLVSMFKQLERGLDAVALEELDPALLEVSRLIDSLNRMQNGNGRDEPASAATNGRRAL